jgi:hypothetical protein
MSLFFWVVTPCGLKDELCNSALKMETARFFEALLSAYEYTWRYSPEEQRQAVCYFTLYSLDFEGNGIE